MRMRASPGVAFSADINIGRGFITIDAEYLDSIVCEYKRVLRRGAIFLGVSAKADWKRLFCPVEEGGGRNEDEGLLQNPA